MSNAKNNPKSGKYQLPEDKFYADHGVQGPERVAVGDPDAIMEQLRSQAGRVHGKWTQEGVGGYIECHNCDDIHGHAVKTDDMLMGTDNRGNPILKKLVL